MICFLNQFSQFNLPLHGGHAPRWLFNRMTELAGAITDVVVDEYGPNEFLNRISDPYWFQAFSCVLGFDWHSSGTTTTTLGALKASIDPEKHGLYLSGGKGSASRKTPQGIERAGDIFNLRTDSVEDMINSSRLSAKVDNSCIQDGYTLYVHDFFVSEKGDWKGRLGSCSARNEYCYQVCQTISLDGRRSKQLYRRPSFWNIM